jgi:hypothetical protein
MSCRMPLGSSRAMVFLHAAVRLEDQRVAQLRVLFPDDRVERDLGILGDAEVAQLTVSQKLLTREIIADRPSNHVDGAIDSLAAISSICSY